MSEDMMLLFGFLLIAGAELVSFVYFSYKMVTRNTGLRERELENEKLELEIQKLELQNELQETESGKTEG